MVADERWYFMKEKLQRFMWGRYGNDRFNQFLMIVALVCLALSFFGLRIFYVLALALLVYAYYRMFSKDLSKRRTFISFFRYHWFSALLLLRSLENIR